MNPTTPELQRADLEALQLLFTEFGAWHTAEELRVFAIHHSVEQLVALGWLEHSGTPGRWCAPSYTAAGELRAAIFGDSSFSDASTLQPFNPSTQAA